MTAWCEMKKKYNNRIIVVMMLKQRLFEVMKSGAVLRDDQVKN